MAIAIIKIGENEPQSYVRYDQLHHHMDVVCTLSDDSDPGVKTLEHFLCLKVDTSSMDEAAYQLWAETLLEEDIENEGEYFCNACAFVFSNPLHLIELCPKCTSPDIDSIEQMAKRCKKQFDIAAAVFFSQETIGKIEAEATIKRSIKPDVYQYVEEYKLANDDKEPPRETVAAYKDTLEDNFKMSKINDLENIVALTEFNAAIRDKLTQSLGI